MKSTAHQIKEIIIASDYSKLGQMEIGQVNSWLKKQFGASFQSSNCREASILIRTLVAWTRQYQHEILEFIDEEIWQGEKLDALTFQRQVLAKAFKRNPQRKKAATIKKMLREMLRLFCSPLSFSTESAFEKNKRRNFVASSKLEGILLED